MKSIKNVTLFIALFCIAFLDASEEATYASTTKKGGRRAVSIHSNNNSVQGLGIITMPPTTSSTDNTATTFQFGDFTPVTDNKNQNNFFRNTSELPSIPSFNPENHTSLQELNPEELLGLANALAQKLTAQNYKYCNLPESIKSSLLTNRITTKRAHATLTHQGKQILQKESLLETLHHQIVSASDDNDWQKSNSEREELLSLYRITQQEIRELLRDIHGLRNQQSFKSEDATLFDYETEQAATLALLQPSNEWPQATTHLSAEQYASRLKALRTAFDSAPVRPNGQLSKAQERRFAILNNLHKRKGNEAVWTSTKDSHLPEPTTPEKIGFHDRSFNKMQVYNDGLLDKVSDLDKTYAAQRADIETLIDIAKRLGDLKKAQDLEEVLRTTELAPFDRTLLNRPEEKKAQDELTHQEELENTVVVLNDSPESDDDDSENKKTTVRTVPTTPELSEETFDNNNNNENSNNNSSFANTLSTWWNRK